MPTRRVIENTKMPSANALLLAFGNPLLDMTIVVQDTSLHKEFLLPVDGQLEINANQQPLFETVKERPDAEYTAGGCSLNTLRVFSWILDEPHKAIFVGGIGDDDKSEKLISILNSSGVITHFVKVPDKPTGSCVALVLGAERCLCADIGAAAVCRPEDIFVDETRLVSDLSCPSVVFIEGYFITHSFDTSLQLAKYCKNAGKILIFNICGSYVCENYFEELAQLLPYVDIIFGFIEEYRSLEKVIDVSKLCEKYSNEENIFHDLKLIFKCLSGVEKPVETSFLKNNQGTDIIKKLPYDLDVENSTKIYNSDKDLITANNNNHTNGSNNADHLDQSRSYSNGVADLSVNVENSVKKLTEIESFKSERNGNSQNCQTTTENSIIKSEISKKLPENHVQSQLCENMEFQPCENSQKKVYVDSQSCGNSPKKAHVDSQLCGNSPKKLNVESLSCENSPRKSAWSGIKNKKLVVVTQGELPIIFSKEKKVFQVDIPPVGLKKIVDTTGAGDSFVGGFLAAAARGQELLDCLECGVWAAQQILQERGCTIPETPANFL